MGKETEFETQPQAWVGREEMKVMKDEERERCNSRLQKWLQNLLLPVCIPLSVFLCSYSHQEAKSVSSFFKLGLVMWLAVTKGTWANVIETEAEKGFVHWGLPLLLLWGTLWLPPGKNKPGPIFWRPVASHLCHSAAMGITQQQAPSTRHWTRYWISP